MGIKRIYEVYSLIVGFASIITILFFLIKFFGSCFFLFEPWLSVRILEIIICLSVIPYYFKKMYEFILENAKN